MPRKNRQPIIATAMPAPAAERVAELGRLFPEAVCEGKVDLERLRALIGEAVDDRTERYTFSWAGKRDAIRILAEPSRATLVPDREQSLDFDRTGNVFIEGDNLEVLKLLYKSYFGRVKMIYIDPPYNTGNDFVYPDNYRDPLDTYLKLTGQRDADGNLLTSNTDASGRYHSAWLSMMYPRLFLARQLLRDDGVIFVSIDDHEVHNLRLLMNEIFGEENFVAQLTWEKSRKNDAKLFSAGHEYIVVFAKSAGFLRENGVVWREEKPGARDILEKYQNLKAKNADNFAAMEKALARWYQELPEAHPAKKLSRYKHIDEWGPWRDRDISWPGGGGPRYDVLHPVTGQPCRVPERGWGFATPEEMDRQIKLGLVVFRESHADPPFRKAHLLPVPDELDGGEAPDAEETEAEEVGLQVMPTVIYRQAQVAAKYLRSLMGGKVFENPKDHEVLARLIQYCTAPDDIVMDFFAGSAATGEAVLQLNRTRQSTRRFVLVQLPEPTPEKSVARKFGCATIADIGKERIRRVSVKLRAGREGELPLPERATPEDLGFRVFRLAESNLRPWEPEEAAEGRAAATAAEMATSADSAAEDSHSSAPPADHPALFVDPLRDGWRAEDVITEIALREGYSLTARVERLSPSAKSAKVGDALRTATVWRVTDAERGQRFHICLDDRLELAALDGLRLERTDLFVCRDLALDDETAANLALQCRLKVI